MCKFTNLLEEKTILELTKKKINKVVYKDYCSFFLNINKYIESEIDYSYKNLTKHTLKNILYKQLQLTKITESEFFSNVYDKRNHPLARESNIDSLLEIKEIFNNLKEIERIGE